MDDESTVGSGVNIELDAVRPHCLRALEGSKGVLRSDCRSTPMGNDDHVGAHSAQ